MELVKDTGKGIPKVKLNYLDQDLLLEIYGLAREGFSDEQIAEALGVAAETFGWNKRKKQKDGSDSPLKTTLTKGMHPLNIMVENALLKLAIGMTVKTITRTWWEFEEMPDGTTWGCKVTETIKELPPDLNAIMLWLRAYMPEIYNVKPMIRVDFTTNSKEITGKIVGIEHIYGCDIREDLRIVP